MVRKISIVILVIAALSVSAVAATADPTVSVVIQNQPVDSLLGVIPMSALSGTAYATQQDALDAINAAAGTSIENWYMYVCVNNACVPVDPYSTGS